MPERRRMYLMRHGDVRYFSRDERPADLGSVPLSPLGREQALAAGRLLAQVPLDRVVTSPLRRTDETASLVLGDRSVPRQVVPAIEEIRPGQVLGLPPEEIASIVVQAFTARLTHEQSFLGGETFGAFLGRVLPWLRQVVADPDWRHLLVVAHGGVNRAILTEVLGAGLNGFGQLEQEPACLNIVDFDETGRGLVRLVNFTAYNPTHDGVWETTMERLFGEYQRLFGGAT